MRKDVAGPIYKARAVSKKTTGRKPAYRRKAEKPGPCVVYTPKG